jgi:hypothetical protein
VSEEAGVILQPHALGRVQQGGEPVALAHERLAPQLQIGDEGALSHAQPHVAFHDPLGGDLPPLQSGGLRPVDREPWADARRGVVDDAQHAAAEMARARLPKPLALAVGECDLQLGREGTNPRCRHIDPRTAARTKLVLEVDLAALETGLARARVAPLQLGPPATIQRRLRGAGGSYAQSVLLGRRVGHRHRHHGRLGHAGLCLLGGLMDLVPLGVHALEERLHAGRHGVGGHGSSRAGSLPRLQRAGRPAFLPPLKKSRGSNSARGRATSRAAPWRSEPTGAQGNTSRRRERRTGSTARRAPSK